MNNTIPFHSATHAPQITVDVNILTMLKQAASCLTEMASENVYLAAIGPNMELTIIVEEDAPSILPYFDRRIRTWLHRPACHVHRLRTARHLLYAARQSP